MRSARALPLWCLALAAACGGGKSGGGVATYTLSVTVSGGGSVDGDPPATSCSSGSCTTSHPSGTQVTLSAAPGGGWAFGGWSGACSGTGVCSFSLTSNRAVTATFTSTAPGANVLPLTVNGATCAGGAGNYLNKPCVRVTVCLPGTQTCQVVDDVLVDTGSYGLRLFKQLLPFSLPTTAAGAGTLAECVQYLDGTSHWGPVASADVVLGGEVVQVPIQVLDATFGPPPSACPGPDASPAVAGLNGILGVGPFAEDCGVGCSTIAANGIYFACNGGTCLGTTVPLVSQVVNPVARLPADNNGVIVDLPPVAPGGQLSVEGSLILGIDTQANNASAGATAYPGHPMTGDIRTTLAGTSISTGFLDTGSNGLFFAPPSSLPPCPGPNQAWFCPAQTTSLSATNSGTSGAPSGPVSFQIGNALSLFATPNNVFSELGGSLPAGAGFDWGLPFFLGQRVYVGIGGRSSNLGTGPYYAY